MPARYGAWKFVHPDLVAGATVPTGTTPGLQVTAGRADTVEGDESIHQSIVLLLSTRLGERVMRPEYGCDLGQFVLTPIDDTTAGLAIHYVSRAIERWEPRIQVLGLDATPNPDIPGKLDLLLEYRVHTTGQDGQMSLSVTGGGA